MLKSLNKYKPVMGIIYNGNPVTDKIKVLKLILAGKNFEIMSWSGGDILFYFNIDNKDIVYPNDITYTYMIDSKPATALELIKNAKSKGFGGNDTNRAAQYLMGKGIRVKNNPNPTQKFTGVKSR
jgi:hypothetical protein